LNIQYLTILPEALGATLLISPFVDIISPIGNADVIRFELPLTNIPTLDDVPNAIPVKPDDVDN
jgi:hypothetical protein